MLDGIERAILKERNVKKYGTNDGGDATDRQPVKDGGPKSAAGAPSDASDKYNAGAAKAASKSKGDS